MWETTAASVSSEERCEGCDSFTVPRFAWFRHFHGSVLSERLNEQFTPYFSPRKGSGSEFVRGIDLLAVSRFDRQIATVLMSKVRQIHAQLEMADASITDSCRLELRCHPKEADHNEYASIERLQRMHRHKTATMLPGNTLLHGNAIAFGALASCRTADITLDVNERDGVIVFSRNDRS